MYMYKYKLFYMYIFIFKNSYPGPDNSPMLNKPPYAPSICALKLLQNSE